MDGTTPVQVLRMLSYSVTNIASLCYGIVLLQRRYSRKKTALLASACALLMLCLNAVCFLCPPDVSRHSHFFPCVTLIKIAVFQGTILLLAKRRDGRTLFAGATASLFAAMSQLLGDITYALCLSRFWGMIVSVLLMVGLLLLCTRFIRKPYQHFFETSSPLFQWLFLLPVCFYVLLYLLAYWPHDIVIHPDLIAPCVIVIGLAILCYCLAFSLLSYELEASKTAMRQELMKAYSKGLLAQNRDLVASREGERIARHDLRHYVTALSSLLADGHVEDARRMLASVATAQADEQPIVCCENAIINSVLYTLFRRAKDNGIRLEARLDLPEQLGRLDSTNLAGVLANLLENAIHATSKLPPDERRIRFDAKRLKGQLILCIKNPYRGSITLDPETGLPVSSSGEGHGFGMKSIAAYTAHTQAVFDLRTDDGVFAVRMLMRL